MTTLEYKAWMEKAFLYVEAALGQELATPGRVCMTEEYFRTSLVRGLSASRPDQAHRIRTEGDAPWSNSACGHCAQAPGGGRRLQHDIVLLPDNDGGLLLEAKWVKGQAAKAIAQDIWKLVLSRGLTAEGQAARCYLLIGGEAEALSDTLTQLRLAKADLRWSNAGRGKTRASRPLNLHSLLNSKLGKEALESLAGWGTAPSRHYRRTPDFWRIVTITRRFDPWLRTIEGTGWRAVLFELHHHGADAMNQTITWASVANVLTRKCP